MKNFFKVLGKAMGTTLFLGLTVIMFLTHHYFWALFFGVLTYCALKGKELHIDVDVKKKEEEQKES